MNDLENQLKEILRKRRWDEKDPTHMTDCCGETVEGINGFRLRYCDHFVNIEKSFIRSDGEKKYYNTKTAIDLTSIHIFSCVEYQARKP